MPKKYLPWLIVILLASLYIPRFFPVVSTTTPSSSEDIVIQSKQPTYYLHDPVTIVMGSHVNETVRITSNCPASPLKVEFYSNGVWQIRSAKNGISVGCVKTPDSNFFVNEPEYFEIQPQKNFEVNFSPWNEELFSSLGKYRVTANLTVKNVQKSFFTDLEIVERGFFSSVFYNIFNRPILNLLILLTTYMPGYNLGLAIILLTLIIRLLLLYPNQRALKSQRKLMKIQPQLDELRRKHKEDQQKLSLETMALWKEHKVNPVGGCLPLLLQIPVLIALFYVVRDGLNPYETSVLYSFQSNVDLSLVSTNFYNILDLKTQPIFPVQSWLPLLVGLLQFAQMKMSFARFKEAPAAITNPTVEDPLKSMNKMMIYFMPIMILLMAQSLPSGVGLYLMVSTLFGILQQFIVNREIK